MPKKNPRKPAGAPMSPERRRELLSIQPPILSTPPASLGYGGPTPTDSWCFPIAHSSSVAAAVDDDDSFMSSGVVNPNVILPQVLPVDDFSLEEGQGPSTSGTIVSPTFYQLDPGIVDPAAFGASGPRHPAAERFPGPVSCESESVYDLEYSTAHVSYPSFSEGTDPGTSGYPNYAATGYQSEDAASSLSSYVRQSLAVSDNVSYLSGASSGDLVNPSPGSYDDPAGRFAPGVRTRQLSVQSTSEESDAPSSSSGSHSRKGSYKHRHRRVYGLTQEDQVERSKALNNEACLLYRERKRKKERDLEAETTQEEERQRRLRREEQGLQKTLEIFKKALGKRGDRGRPDDGSQNL
ncbi:uncharacterized protein LOC135200230 [Macrobrachium nipponense]|uniref:uncharacterized protein LOC135200230 n=1 Tax=Macrobrachium nipponense TaxID=159736 RepID=UPI0030C8C3EE